MAAKSKKTTIEQDFEKLKQIAENLENSETGLEDALVFYKEGIDLSISLNKRLTKAEGEVKILKKKFDKEFSLEDFSGYEYEDDFDE